MATIDIIFTVAFTVVAILGASLLFLRAAFSDPPAVPHCPECGEAITTSQLRSFQHSPLCSRHPKMENPE